MTKFIILLILLPGVGVYTMEEGSYGYSIGKIGYQNGATLAYAVYAIVFLAAYFLTKDKTIKKFRFDTRQADEQQVLRLLRLCLVINVVLFLCLILIFGSWKVFLGQERGEFRANLPYAGFLYYYILKYWAPSLLAYAFFHYLGSKKTSSTKLLMFSNFIIVILIGASTGFKTTFLTLILPALLLILWRISTIKLMTLGMFILLPILSLSTLLVEEFAEFDQILDFLFTRSTTLLGDAAWLTWDKIANQEYIPNAWPAFVSVLGDTFLQFAVIQVGSEFAGVARYDFTYLFHEVIGIPLEAVKMGHNIQGTPFSIALILFGVSGIVVAPIVQGIFLGKVHNVVQRKIDDQKADIASLWLTYLVLFVFSWMQGGMPTTLFHISMVPGFLSTLVILRYIGPRLARLHHSL